MAAADARGDRVAGAAAARRHRRLVPGRRPRARPHPPRRVVVRLRRRARRVRARARPALRARARRRDRGGGRDRQPGADRAHRGLAGRRRRCTTACSSASTPDSRPAAVGLVQLAPRSSPARCAPATGASSACWRSPARSPSRPSAPRTCGSREVLADLAAFALERAAAARRTRSALGRATRAVSATLDPDEVDRRRCSSRSRELTGAAERRLRSARTPAGPGARRRRAGARPASEVRVPRGARRAAVRRADRRPPAGRVRGRRRRRGWSRSRRWPRRRSPTRTPTTASGGWRAR